MTERCFVRFTLEALSPVSIGSGDLDPVLDTPLVRDVNAMPCIPAPGLAGALRARLDEATAREMFGIGGTDSHRSPVLLSDALCHWADNRPREGICYKPEKNDVVDLLRRDAPVGREHVRLDELGVSDGAGKFERAAVPAGTRFTGQMECADAAQAETIREILAQGMRLGGATRLGYGLIGLVGWGCEPVDMRKRDVAIKYLDLGLDTKWPGDFKQLQPQGATEAEIHISGRFSGPLLIGSSARSAEVDREPYSEPVIVWPKGEDATVSERTVVPGSAIKGALRHRTLYHLRRTRVEEAEIALAALFGSERGGADSGERGSHAGRLVLDDALLSGDDGGACKSIDVPHVGIDRFTGGARDGLLFQDRMLWRPRMSIRIGLEPDCESCAAWCAFEAALEDLRNGILGIGAEWGDGAGVFKADPTAAEGSQ